MIFSKNFSNVTVFCSLVSLFFILFIVFFSIIVNKETTKKISTKLTTIVLNVGKPYKIELLPDIEIPINQKNELYICAKSLPIESHLYKDFDSTYLIWKPQKKEIFYFTFIASYGSVVSEKTLSLEVQ